MRAFRAEQARAETSEELIHKHELTVEGVAEICQLPADAVRHATWEGALPTRALGKENCGVARTGLVVWLQERGESSSPAWAD